jgi:hypothetical protein
MRLSWLIFAIVATMLCNIAYASDALACGSFGNFGGCLAHGQFDSSVNESFGGINGRFHRGINAGVRYHRYIPLKRPVGHPLPKL